jgi:hypothetical protein
MAAVTGFDSMTDWPMEKIVASSKTKDFLKVTAQIETQARFGR